MEKLNELLPIKREPLSLEQRLSSPLVDWNTKAESCREEGKKRFSIVNQARLLKRRAPKNQKTKVIIEYALSQSLSAATLRSYLKIANEAKESARKTGSDEIMAQVIALTPGYGTNKGSFRAFSPEAINYAKTLYLSQSLLNVSDVFKHVVNEAISHGWKIGSCDSLRYILKQEATPSLMCLARKGFKHYQADCEFKILRNYSEVLPLDMLCGDHHIFDVFVLVGNKLVRPWVTLWIDIASRSIMGWCVSVQPNSQTIALALAHSICKKNDGRFPQYGLPASVYVDNGKDYRSKYLSGEEVSIGKIDYPEIIEQFSMLGIDPFYINLKYDPDQEAWVKERGKQNLIIKKICYGGVFARLGISQRFATAYHPWAKPIERMIKNIVQSFSRQLPGWCGSTPDQRPEKLNGEIQKGQVLNLQKFCERWYEWVIQYNNTPHSGHGMNDRTPTEIFLSGAAPQEVDPDLLTFALLKKDQVRIYNWGFKLMGYDFELDIPADHSGGAILNNLINRYATIFYDLDLKTIRVYLEGRYICNARPLRRASFIRQDCPVFEDKLKLQALQRQQNKIILDGIQQKALPEPDRFESLQISDLAESGGQPLTFTDPKTQPLQLKQPVDFLPVTEEEKYRWLMQLRADQKEITEEDIEWEKEYKGSDEFQRMQPIYDAEFNYLKHCATKGA